MESRWHVNPHTGTTGRCRVRVKKCPFGGDSGVENHYATEHEAKAAYEKAMESNKLARPVRRDSLKDMNANDLSHEIFLRLELMDVDSNEFSDILELTSILHAEQRRRPRVPGQEALYIEHPLRVSLRLLRQGVKDPATIKGALLHDAVEDGSITFARDFLGEQDVDEPRARERFISFISESHGRDTAAVVSAVTNDYVPEEQKAHRSKEEKNRLYREHVVREINSDERALLVKLSDFLDNGGSLHHTDIPGFEEKTKGQAVKYLPLSEVFLEKLEHEHPHLSPEAREHFQGKVRDAARRMESIVKKYENLP